MKKDIRNYNSKGKTHGYQEIYYKDKILLRGEAKNARDIGYNEWHASELTDYYIR
jgi:hypothetical protein